MKTFVNIDETMCLVSQKVENRSETVNVAKKTNHIFVVDVSGSMYHDLPLIRTQLKNKLSNIMKEGDTISIVWFSGRHESGILKEEVEVKSLKTLSDLNDAIDKWLRPVGLTAFLKPLVLVKELVGRIRNNRPDSVFSMIFLSDGYNNDCPWNEVISTLKNLENDIVASTFVEYGFYADTQKLTQMASILGGEKVSCDGFDDFEPVFDKRISSTIRGGKKVVVEITDHYLYDFAYSIVDGAITLYKISDGKVLVSSDVEEVHFFSPFRVGEKSTFGRDTELYAGIYLLADKLMNDEAEKVFYGLGDNHYYKMLVNAFGKQKLNGFKNAIKECVIDESKRFPEGRHNIQPVAGDAYCLLNLLFDLADKDAIFYPNHEDFVYNRIGVKRVAKGSDLSDAEKKRLAEAKSVSEANEILEELKEKNVDLKFVKTNPKQGYSLSDMVWNSERANLSIRIRIDGEAILPANKFGIDKVATYKYNTFTLIRDGIVNVDKLPVGHSSELYDFLKRMGVNFEVKADENVAYIIIDLKSLPLINKIMVKTISANDLALMEWKLILAQGEKKVYDHYRKLLFPKKSESYAEMLGEECAEWLKEIGITDYNGFAPKTVDEESTDFYMSVNLAIKIKGLSSLPKVEDVVAKLKAGTPLKLSEWVLSLPLKDYLRETESDMFKALPEEQQKEVLNTYLVNKSKQMNVNKNKIMKDIAQIKFAVILSKKWFNEFTSFDENQATYKFDDQELQFTFDLSEKEIKI